MDRTHILASNRFLLYIECLHYVSHVIIGTLLTIQHSLEQNMHEVQALQQTNTIRFAQQNLKDAT